MKDALYALMGIVAKFHRALMSLNDAYEARFSDKELHFLIIGALGIALFVTVHFVFRRLAKWSVATISWIYTMTLLTVIAFGIEIGQGFTKTGLMEFSDILFGLWGFVVFYAAFWVVKTMFALVVRTLKGGAKSPYESEEEE